MTILLITLAVISLTMLVITSIMRCVSDIKSKVQPRKRSNQYIYFIQSRGENPLVVKIGRTKNYAARLRAHKTANPYGIRVLGILAVKNMQGAERFLHLRFSKNRIAREWFRLTPFLYITILALRDKPLTEKAKRYGN